MLAGRDIVAHCANAHSAALYRDWLNHADYRLWLAEAHPGQAPVGFMALAPAQLPLPDISTQDVEIKRIYLLSRFQGGGLGKRLVLEAVDEARQRNAKRLLLGVYARNDAAIGFYERMGFQKFGTRRFNVGGHDYDDHIMGMVL